ncbi:hypothetical protein LTS08_008456 [Lithohypha guttulata]|nr:hypothetical protein LTS08_008456 [Lithohypha guttulata]
MRFRMQAISPQDCQLSDFELKLSFSARLENSEDDTPDIAAQGSMSDLQLNDQPEVYLVELPAPSCVPTGPELEFWKFRSDSAADEQTGYLYAARWIWETYAEQRRLEGIRMHGGVALRHPGRPFSLECQVKGKVSKPGGIRLKFSNEHHCPRVWQVVPEICQDDLQRHIAALEDEMIRLNTTGILQPMPPQVAQDLLRGEGHRYAPTQMAGAANAHFGDNIFFR